MAFNLGNFRYNVGTSIAGLGNRLGLPEFGLSEAVGGYKAPDVYTQQTLGYNIPGSTYGPAVKGAATATPPPTTTPVSQPQSQPRPQVNNFDDVYAQFYPGWGKTQAQADFNSAYGGDINRLLQSRGWGTGEAGPDMGQVNSIFDEVNSILDQRRSSAVAGKDDYLKGYTAPYEGIDTTINQGRENALTVNKSQQDATQLRESNAIADARRILNELTQANRQRFGGSSSSGEFADSILGREYMRNVGQIQNTTGQSMQDLYQKSQEINTTYDSYIQDLNSKKAQALTMANEQFQAKLDDIDNQRTQNAANKAQAKLAELMNHRQNLQNITNAFTQAEINAKSQAQAAAQNLISSVASYRAQSAQPLNLPELSQSVFSAFGGGAQAAPSFAYGQRSPRYRLDPLTGQIVPA